MFSNQSNHMSVIPSGDLQGQGKVYLECPVKNADVDNEVKRI